MNHFSLMLLFNPPFSSGIFRPAMFDCQRGIGVGCDGPKLPKYHGKMIVQRIVPKCSSWSIMNNNDVYCPLYIHNIYIYIYILLSTIKQLLRSSHHISCWDPNVPGSFPGPPWSQRSLPSEVCVHSDAEADERHGPQGNYQFCDGKTLIFK